MTEVHRYHVVKMLSEGGNRISYDPHGPEVVMASAYDQLKTENERLAAACERAEQIIIVECKAASLAKARANLLEADRDQLRAEIAGLKTGYEAYERVNAELKQKVANLEVCQTVSLGMSGIIKCVAGELGFDAAGEDSAQDYLIGLARRASELKAENEALRKERDARHPFKPLHEPSIGYTGCVICGVYTDHGGLPCPKTRATADAAMAKGQQS